MSQPLSNPRLRNSVFTQLTALLETGGPLAATPAGVDAFLTDRRLADAAAQYRSMSPNAPSDGYAAIITAGPPGAGKSTVTAGLAPDHRRIDPDEIKDLLLTELVRAHLLAARGQIHPRRRHRRLLPGGHRPGLGVRQPRPPALRCRHRPGHGHRATQPAPRPPSRSHRHHHSDRREIMAHPAPRDSNRRGV